MATVLRSFIIIFLVMLSPMAFTQEISIGFSQFNKGPISTENISHILKCTSGLNDLNFSFQSLPNLRGLQYVKQKKIDAYYPVHVNSKNLKKTLLPIYIDEVLLISKKPIGEESPKKIGVVYSEQSYVLDHSKKFTVDFSVNGPESLLEGLNKGRVKYILLNRSQLPKGFDLSTVFIKTVKFVDVGIQFNENFETKLGKSREELQRKFISCILNYDFKLSNIRKRAIQIAIEEDIAKLKEDFKGERVSVSAILNKEERWKAKDKRLIESVLTNKLSMKLKELEKRLPFITEAFIYNHQGALLGSLKMTSDFDQSDEKKFSILRDYDDFSIRNISNIYFDESTNSFQVGIFIRINDKKDRFSRGLYIGANINELISFYKLN